MGAALRTISSLRTQATNAPLLGLPPFFARRSSGEALRWSGHAGPGRDEGGRVQRRYDPCSSDRRGVPEPSPIGATSAGVSSCLCSRTPGSGSLFRGMPLKST